MYTRVLRAGWLLRGQASFEISACNRVEVIQDRGTCFELSEWKALGSWTLEVRLNANLFYLLTLDLLLLFLEWWSRCEWRINPTRAAFFSFFWDCTVADHLFDCGKLDWVCSSSTDLKIITIFRYVKRSAIFFSNTCGAIVKKINKKKNKKTVHSTNEDWSWKISPSLCWTFRNWFVLYFNFLSLIVTYSTQFTWQGHRKLQWAMSKDEPLLSNCPLETAEPNRNYARVPGYKKKYKKKTRKRREKKRKMNGVEINTRAYVATRLLLRWDYLYGLYPVEHHLFARLYTRATLCSAQPKWAPTQAATTHMMRGSTERRSLWHWSFTAFPIWAQPNCARTNLIGARPKWWTT